MASIALSDKALMDQQASCIVVLVEQDKLDTYEVKAVEKLFPALNALIKEREFSGKALTTLVVPVSCGNNLQHFMFVGLGKKNKKDAIDIETYRRALAKAVRVAESCKFDSLAIQLPSEKICNVGAAYFAQQSVIALDMALYSFSQFITDKSNLFEVQSILLVANDSNAQALQAGVKDGLIIAHSVALARHCVDSPPSHLTPLHLAQVAEKVAKKNNLKITIFDEKALLKMGMGGITGVSKGSDNDCQLVILEYHCVNKNAPTLAFVGKGITFDSGGLSIKPGDAMEDMKIDMSGAAAVIAAMDALAQLKPNVNVVGIAPMTENLPSGKAIMPGDVLTFYNGKTAEVKNTDAEGRLILADALSYAVKHYKPDAIVDLATLTGACAYALGPFFSGLMGNSDHVINQVERAAATSGDAVWRLPFTDDYKAAIKSPIADMQNIGSRTYRAGAITAGHFLAHFVDDVPWAHLDIAGTAHNVPDLPYYRAETATGVGVRLLVDIAQNWQ